MHFRIVAKPSLDCIVPEGGERMRKVACQTVAGSQALPASA
jgi:hypothetical protein